MEDMQVENLMGMKNIENIFNNQNEVIEQCKQEKIALADMIEKSQQMFRSVNEEFQGALPTLSNIKKNLEQLHKTIKKIRELDDKLDEISEREIAIREEETILSTNEEEEQKIEENLEILSGEGDNLIDQNLLIEEILKKQSEDENEKFVTFEEIGNEEEQNNNE